MTVYSFYSMRFSFRSLFYVLFFQFLFLSNFNIFSRHTSFSQFIINISMIVLNAVQKNEFHTQMSSLSLAFIKIFSSLMFLMRFIYLFIFVQSVNILFCCCCCCCCFCFLFVNKQNRTMHNIHLSLLLCQTGLIY